MSGLAPTWPFYICSEPDYIYRKVKCKRSLRNQMVIQPNHNCSIPKPADVQENVCTTHLLQRQRSVCPSDVMRHCLLCAAMIPHAYSFSGEKTVAGRLQTIWFDWKHNKSHVGPGIQSHIITDKQPPHKPTSLIPKPFYFVVNVPPMANPSLPQSHPAPTPLKCACVCVSVCRDESEFRHSWHHHPVTCSALDIIMNALTYLTRSEITRRTVLPAGGLFC